MCGTPFLEESTQNCQDICVTISKRRFFEPPGFAPGYGAAANEKWRITINRFREVLGMRARPRVAVGSAAPIKSDAKTHRTPKVLRAKRG
jgi:hypothetical protein